MHKKRCQFDSAKLLSIAHVMADTGMVNAGFSSLNIDDCWPLKARRASDGALVPDPAKFPNGMRHFSDQLAALGVRLYLNGEGDQ